LRLFRWLSASPIPRGIDLRRCGWQITGGEAEQDEDGPVPALGLANCLEDMRWSSLGDWRFQPLRRLLLLIGIDDEDARARLLRLGYGDVLGSRTSLREIEQRALRIVAQAEALPRIRDLGNLRLDLFARDGFVGRQQLGLHPREFALIWRLADSPGIAVAKKMLVRDVWRMAHVPDTNSLAVHVFRLRAKLAIAGLTELVRTSPSGGYFLALPSTSPTIAPFMLAESDGQEAAAMAMSVALNLSWEPQP
jgi:two-component system, OmpR family, response regulator